jgi:unsaturated rhamnogalacturonyl hydrolase
MHGRTILPLMITSRFVALLVFLGLSIGTARAAQPEAFSSWPRGASPTEVGERVTKNFLARPFQWQTNPKRTLVIYPEVCAWYGSLTYAELTHNTPLTEQLVAKYDILLSGEGATKISSRDHVDDRVFGAAPLEIYRQTKDEKFLTAGRTLADGQWNEPTADGITHEARYWIDDMYMITLLQVQAFRATGDGKYLDRAALTMAAYLAKLQQPNGLFFHAPDSPFYWGRGNGWVAAGLTELLQELPEKHPQHKIIVEGYHKMMTALLAAQGGDGMWRQLLDKPETWSESSCTGMFTFAFVTGVKRGWLDEKTYAPAARKAWLALVDKLDANANVKDVCVGTNKSHQETKSDDLKVQYDFYLARKRVAGDLHGQAPLLWSASALLR